MRDLWLCVPGSRRVCPDQQLRGLYRPLGKELKGGRTLVRNALTPSCASQGLVRCADSDVEMLRKPTVGEQELLAQALRRDADALGPRERWAEGLTAAVFLVAVGLLVLLRPPDAFHPVAVGACIVVLVVASRVQFHVASGFTVPTQLAFVPLLFVMPAATAPLAVATALVLGRAPEVLRGRTAPGRLINAVGNAWFAVGPAAVLVVCGTESWRASATVLLIAFVAQFAIDFAISAARDAVESHVRLRDQLRETWVYAVDAALTPAALFAAPEVHRRPLTVLGLVPLLAVFAGFARERRARLESVIELKDAYHGTALVLGDVVEADDEYTGRHCRSVVELALAVADRLAMSSEACRNVEFGALLHDVGKVAIPKEIINKTGKLTSQEWTIIKTHTVEGQKMLDRVGGFMREVGQIVRSHHERWDGGGYPDGLAGKSIPLESRIIACCDSWNAMRTTRAYRPALPHEDAVGELVSNAGTQFDPSIVEVLLEVVAAEQHFGPAVDLAA